MKMCKRCGESKPLTKYRKNTRCRDGYELTCKPCIKSTSAAYYLEHKEQIKERSKEWRQNNLEKSRASVRNYLKRSRDGMAESFLITRLSKSTGISIEKLRTVPDIHTLIDLKKTEIELWRKLKSNSV